MKVRHAAALALTGWYLMVPPTIESRNQNCASYKADTSQALRTNFHAYDSAAACEKGGHDEALRAADEAETAIVAVDPNGRCSDPMNRASKEAYAALERMAALTGAQCVASDDPRLKEK
jgi:hypothetical protein